MSRRDKARATDRGGAEAHRISRRRQLTSNRTCRKRILEPVHHASTASGRIIVVTRVQFGSSHTHKVGANAWLNIYATHEKRRRCLSHRVSCGSIIYVQCSPASNKARQWRKVCVFLWWLVLCSAAQDRIEAAVDDNVSWVASVAPDAVVVAAVHRRHIRELGNLLNTYTVQCVRTEGRPETDMPWCVIVCV